MNKIFTRLGVYLFSLLGILMLSCGSTPRIQKEQDADSSKKKAREQAFAEVVNALHAPYSTGDKFFRIFTGASATEETKEGSAVSVKDGDNSIGGKGTWTVKAGKDNEQNGKEEDSIVYTYEKFQPKGSKIVIDGKMISMYRSKGFENGSDDDEGDSIAFHKNGNAIEKNDNGIVYSSGSHKDEEVKIGENGVKEIKESASGSYSITLADVLTINGEYQATLEFIYPIGGIHSDVDADDYEKKLIGDDDGMFTAVGSYIEFTYDGKTQKLTKDEIKKLITVA